MSRGKEKLAQNPQVSRSHGVYIVTRVLDDHLMCVWEVNSNLVITYIMSSLYDRTKHDAAYVFNIMVQNNPRSALKIYILTESAIR